MARLATTGASGPHIVPIVFAASGDRIVTAVDHKPKRTRRLRRLTNIAADPAVAVLVDHYDDDWAKLWWVRADGSASVLESGPGFSSAVELLGAKYGQYRDHPPSGPVIDITVERWVGWSG